MKKLLITLLFLFPLVASAQLVTTQGGTGTTSPSGILFGDLTLHLKTLKIGSGLSLSNGSLSATAAGGTVTQVNTTYPLLGGPITTTGTLSVDFSTSTLSATSPLTGSFIQVGSGGALGIQAASASLNGYLSSFDFQLLHTATTTFSSPLIYTASTNAVTCPTCGAGTVATTSFAATVPITISTSPLITYGIQSASASQVGSMSAADFQLLHAATTTFSSPLVYTLSTNAVTCPTCIVTASAGGTATTSFARSAPITLTTSASAITYGFSGLATTTQPSSSNVLTSDGASGVYGTATSTLTPSSPLTGSFTHIGSGGSIGIQAASASQVGSMAAGDFQRLYAATTTFSAPLVYTLSTNAVTCTNASSGVTGCMSANDWALLHAATTTFSSPLVYTLGTNAVTCPSCSTITTPVSIANGGTNASSFTTNGNGVYYNGTSLLTAPLTSAVTYPYASTTAISSTNASTTNLIVSTNAAIGTSTPWATFSVVSPTSPLFSVASSSSGTPFFNIFSTTTILQLASTITSPVVDLGVRIGVGTTNYLGFGGLLDQFVVRGRINTEGWNQSFCDIVSAQGGSAQSNLCGNFAAGAAVATNPVFTNTASNSAGYAYAASNISIGQAAGSGATFFFANNSGSTGWLVPATSTPVMEINSRIEFPQNSTSSRYYIGFDSNNKNGTMTVTAPTNGCFFTASSSASFGDWWAVAISGGTGTWVDTKIASSTNLTSKGGFYKFRIEASTNDCVFYIQNAQANPLTVVANITTNVPNTTGLNASVWLTTDSGSSQVSLDFNHFRVWWRDFLPTI